jgi:hypothetical protein
MFPSIQIGMGIHMILVLALMIRLVIMGGRSTSNQIILVILRFY